MSLKLLAILAAFILLAVTINSAAATTLMQNNTLPSALPNFLESYLEYQAAEAHLTSSQIIQMRALWTQQLALNQELIDSAYGNSAENGVVISGVSPAFTDYPSYMLEFCRTETPGTGQVYNPLNVFGQPDGNYAELYTPNSGDGASIVGEMSGSVSDGFIHVCAALTQQGYQFEQNNGGDGNYVMIEVDNSSASDPLWVWMEGFIGYAHIVSTSENDYIVGGVNDARFTTGFKYIDIGAMVMPGPPTYPLPNTKDQFNDIYVDSVSSTAGNSPVSLTIPNVSDGTTYAYDQFNNYLGTSGTFLATEDNYIQVTAYPDTNFALSNWNLDGNDIGDANPVSVTMDTDHTLQANFVSQPWAWLYLSTSDDYGLSVQTANLYVDGNWVGQGSASVYLPMGTHNITADPYAWDQNEGTVWLVGGTGPVTLTSDTYATVYYSINQ